MSVSFPQEEQGKGRMKPEDVIDNFYDSGLNAGTLIYPRTSIYEVEGGWNNTGSWRTSYQTGKRCMLPKSASQSWHTRLVLLACRHSFSFPCTSVDSSIQTVIPSSLRPRIWYFAHYPKRSNHPESVACTTLWDASSTGYIWPATFTRQFRTFMTATWTDLASTASSTWTIPYQPAAEICQNWQFGVAAKDNNREPVHCRDN